jgi:hypothetical protein
MSMHHDLLILRAREARAEAEAATLENVRQRCLRSAAAWETMAARLLKTEVYRINQAAAKAAAAIPNGMLSSSSLHNEDGV